MFIFSKLIKLIKLIKLYKGAFSHRSGASP